MAEGKIGESGPPRGWRRALVLALLATYSLLALASFVIIPAALGPVMTVPPNRVLAPPAVWVAVAQAAGFFQAFWWAIGLGFVTAALLAWMGALDRFLKPCVLAAFLLLAVLAGSAWWAHTLPERIRRGHGEDVHRALFGERLRK